MGGGGGKSHTSYQLSTSHMMNQSDNLFVKDVVRTVAYSKDYNSLDIGKTLQHNVFQFINTAMYKKFGVAPKINFIQEKITSESILSALLHNGHGDASSVNSYSTNDDAENMITYKYHFLQDYLSSEYSIDLTITLSGSDNVLYDGSTHSFNIDFYKYNIPFNTSMYYIDANGNNINLSQDTSGFYIVDAGVNYYAPTQFYFDVSSIDIINYIISFSGSVIFTDNSGNTITKTIYYNEQEPIDNAVYYIVKFTDTSGSIQYAVLPKSVIIAEANTSQYALMYVTKNNGNYIAENTRYKKALYVKFGLQQTDFDSQITSNSDIQSVAITFSTNINNSKYANYINQIYGTAGNRHTVTINGELSLQYSQAFIGYKLKINGVNFNTKVSDDGQHDLMIMPLNAYTDAHLKDKYEMIKNTMNIMTYSSHTTHSAWYQSGIFGAIIGIIAVLVFKVPIQIMVGGFVISKIASAISPELGMIVSLAIAYEGFSEADSFLSKTANIASALDTVSKYYFKLQIEDINKEIASLNDKQKIMFEKLQKMKKQSIYMPLDYTQNYYDMIYSQQYNYDDMYNFDNLYKINNMV